METKEFLARFTPSTRRTYETYLNYLAGQDLGKMTVSQLVSFFEERNWAPNTRRLCLGIIKKYLKFLGVQKSPLFDFRISQRNSRRPRVITPEQVEALLEICDPATPIGLRNQALIRTFWDTWIRASELCSLLESDLDLENLELTITQKGGHHHTTCYSPETAEWLRRWLKHKKAMDCPHVFCNTRTGQALTTNGLRAILRKLGIRAGFKLSAHDFRRGGATHYANNGGNDRLGMDHGGWKNHSMYSRYTKQVSRTAFKKQAWGVEHA